MTVPCPSRLYPVMRTGSSDVALKYQPQDMLRVLYVFGGSGLKSRRQLPFSFKQACVKCDVISLQLEQTASVSNSGQLQVSPGQNVSRGNRLVLLRKKAGTTVLIVVSAMFPVVPSALKIWLGFNSLTRRETVLGVWSLGLLGNDTSCWKNGSNASDRRKMVAPKVAKDLFGLTWVTFQFQWLLT